MRKLAVLALILAATLTLHASPISGSFPVVLFSATQNNSNLMLSTKFQALNTLTSSVGTGSFAIIPVSTSFGPFSLNNSTVLGGGGFSMFNALFGSLSATSGSIIHQSPNFLDIRLLGTFDPGPAFSGASPVPAVAHVSFTQTGNSLSGSYTLAATAVPEPGTLALLGSGMIGLFSLRRFVM